MENIAKYDQFQTSNSNFYYIWVCFALHNYIRRMNSLDISILENLENINELQDTERNFNDGDDNSVSQHNEWPEPTQEDIRHIEETRSC
jgi:hypothetical protein